MLIKSRMSFSNVILANARIQENYLDAGSVIPDLIRDRHDKFGIFCETYKVLQCRAPR